MSRRAWMLASLKAREAQEGATESRVPGDPMEEPESWTVLVCPFMKGTPEAAAFRAEHQGERTIIADCVNARQYNGKRERNYMLETLPPIILADFAAYAFQEAPKEACGLVIQLPDTTLAFRPVRNVAKDPIQGGEMDVVDWDRAEDEGVPIAVLHSHPNASATPSEIDRVFCVETLIPWFILGRNGELVRIDPKDGSHRRAS